MPQINRLKQRYGVARISIVAHSKGGLDSRAYISWGTANVTNDVETLITLASPHHGSHLADLLGLWTGIQGEETPAVYNLTESMMQDFFNPRMPAHYGVQYHSIAADAGKLCRFLWIRWLCAENWQQRAWDPEDKSPFALGIGFALLARHGDYQGTNDFAVTVRSTQIISSVPGHTSANTTQYTYDRNHHSIKAALKKEGEKDTTIVNLIAGILSVNSVPASVTAFRSTPQVEMAEPEATGSSLGVESGAIAEGQLFTVPVGVDTPSEISFLLTWETGDLYFNLIDPNGRVITPTTVDPNIVYSENREGELSGQVPWSGRTASFSVQTPTNGVWKAQISAAAALPGDAVDWMLIIVHDSAVTVSLTRDAAWKPLNTSVRLVSEVKVAGAPLVGATVTSIIFRPDGTSEMLILYDDGVHGDGASADGVYGNSFAGSQYGTYLLSVKATGVVNALPFSRTAISHIQFGSGTARVSGAFSDRGVDSDGDGLYNTLQVDVPVQVTTAGEYAVFAELRSATGGVLAYSNATAALASGQHKLTLNFSGEEIWANGGNGRFTLAALRLDDMGADDGPLQIDFKPAPHTTANYTRDQFQHAAVGLTGVTHDHAVDTNGNGKYDELVVEVEVDLATAGDYSWSGRLIDGAGQELGTDEGEVMLDPGLRTITFHFNGNAIGASRHHGPYFLVDLYLWGDGGFVNTPSAATTAFYNYRQFEGAPATVELFLPAISR